jgi:hypothetical protein
VIVEVDQQPVRSPAEVAAIQRKKSGKLLLRIVRDGHSFYVVVG